MDGRWRVAVGGWMVRDGRRIGEDNGDGLDGLEDPGKDGVEDGVWDENGVKGRLNG